MLTQTQWLHYFCLWWFLSLFLTVTRWLLKLQPPHPYTKRKVMAENGLSFYQGRIVFSETSQYMFPYCSLVTMVLHAHYWTSSPCVGIKHLPPVLDKNCILLERIKECVCVCLWVGNKFCLLHCPSLSYRHPGTDHSLYGFSF